MLTQPAELPTPPEAPEPDPLDEVELLPPLPLLAPVDEQAALVAPPAAPRTSPANSSDGADRNTT
jgi:hypothetical protein